MPKEFRKYKGQLIESLCISSVCIELDNFRPYADRLVEGLLVVQREHIGSDDTDPQRRYLLAAWQRL